MLPLLDSYVRAQGLERYLVTPFMPSGSLQDQLFDDEKGLPYGQLRLRIAQGIAAGLRYLHQKKVFHRDLKPANVLLDEQLKPYIGGAREKNRYG